MKLTPSSILPVALFLAALGAPGHADTVGDAIDQQAKAVEARMIAWRRDIHQHPELGNREFRTGQLIAEHLRALGAEIFEGDFLDARAVQRAAEGTSAIYFAYPVQDGLLDATAAMALAAREAGITRLVNLVMLQSSIDAPTPRMRQNYLSEQVFEWAGIGAVHIRATVFYENLGSQVRQSLPAQGAVRLPWGKETTVLPLVAAEDVARVAVAC